MRMNSSNPVFKKLAKEETIAFGNEATATYLGIAGKAMYYLLLTAVGAALGIFLLIKSPNIFTGALIVSFIVGFVSAMISFMKPNVTKITGSIYCVAEGLALGAISLVFESIAPGVVFSAVVGTFAVVLVVSALYLTNIVKVNGKFVRFLTIFALSFIFSQLIVFLVSLIIPDFIDPFGGFGLISGFISCFLAALYLLFDLEVIKNTVETGQPKFLEWFAAFGIIYTTLWVYVEILRLVTIFASSKE